MKMIKEIVLMVHFVAVLLAAMIVGNALGMTSDPDQITLGTAIIGLVLLAVGDLAITGPVYLAARRSRH